MFSECSLIMEECMYTLCSKCADRLSDLADKLRPVWSSNYIPELSFCCSDTKLGVGDFSGDVDWWLTAAWPHCVFSRGGDSITNMSHPSCPTLVTAGCTITYSRSQIWFIDSRWLHTQLTSLSLQWDRRCQHTQTEQAHETCAPPTKTHTYTCD